MQPEIVLYSNTPTSSPYVMAAFVALEEKGLSYRLELIDLAKGEQHQPDFVAHSITNRVPTLRLTDSQRDVWLSESVAIIEYLEERFTPPGYPRLYPEDLDERARVRLVQGLVRSDFMAIRQERSTETIFFGVPIVPLSERAEAERVRLIRIAAALVRAGQRSIGAQFSIADVDLATMLQRLIANGDQIPANLADYANQIWQRPSVQKWLALTRYRNRERPWSPDSSPSFPTPASP
jgi:glutathione S-transferase